MSHLSYDGNSLLGVGPWSVCVECGEGTHQNDEATRHADGCPLDAAPASRALRPVTHAQSYVLTDRGIEKEIDVQRRRDGQGDR